MIRTETTSHIRATVVGRYDFGRGERTTCRGQRRSISRPCISRRRQSRGAGQELRRDYAGRTQGEGGGSTACRRTEEARREQDRLLQQSYVDSLAVNIGTSMKTVSDKIEENGARALQTVAPQAVARPLSTERT